MNDRRFRRMSENITKDCEEHGGAYIACKYDGRDGGMHLCMAGEYGLVTTAIAYTVDRLAEYHSMDYDTLMTMLLQLLDEMKEKNISYSARKQESKNNGTDI